jgi:hypothetical protein
MRRSFTLTLSSRVIQQRWQRATGTGRDRTRREFKGYAKRKYAPLHVSDGVTRRCDTPYVDLECRAVMANVTAHDKHARVTSALDGARCRKIAGSRRGAIGAALACQ